MFLLISGRHVDAHLGLHTNLYKFVENVSPHIFHKRNFCDLNLGEKSLYISTFFLFPDSGLNLLNGFDFLILIYFEWRDVENQQYMDLGFIPYIIIMYLVAGRQQ